MIEQSWLSTFWIIGYDLQPFLTILFLLFWRSRDSALVYVCVCVCVCVRARRAAAETDCGTNVNPFFPFLLSYWMHLLLVSDDVSHVGLGLLFSVCRSVCSHTAPLQSNVPCNMSGKVQHSPSVGTVTCLLYLACFVKRKTEGLTWRPTRLYIR